jgi:hypothetical protein
MAKKQAAKKAKTPKASGPVHMLRGYFAKLKIDEREATSKVVAFAEQNKIEKGTALTQLSRYRKEQGVSMRAASGEGKKAAKPKAKKAAKGKRAKKSAAAPEQAAATA